MRFSRWIFIFCQFLWLNVILPGHTRGAYTVPDGARQSVSTCCESHDEPSDSQDGKIPSDSDRQRCAMCFMIAGLTVAPPVIFWQPLVDQIVEQHITLQTQLISQQTFGTLHGRAPPMA